MNSHTEIANLKKQLQIEKERIRVMSVQDNQVLFEYNPMQDCMIIRQKLPNKKEKTTKMEGVFSEQSIHSYIWEEEIGKFKRHVKRALEQAGAGEFEIRLKQDTKIEWYRIHYSNILGENSEITYVVGRAVNIQKRKDDIAKLEVEMRKDPVTGLKNPFATQIAIEEEIEKNPKMSGVLLILQIEGMEQIFDSFGRVFGSAVLQNMGDSIESGFRKTDIVGRTGANEFVIFMKKVGEKVASCKAEDICRRIVMMYAGENELEVIAANIGMAYYAKDGYSYQTLYEHAQTAVSYAVRQRRGAIMAYEADMKSEVKSQRPPCFPQEKKISEKYDMNFLLFAFSLLSHSKDTNSAINLLLERIGTRYDLSCVHILEKDRENHCLIPTNLWEREYGISKDMECVFYEEENEFGEFDQQGSLCVKDCDKNPIKGYESICRHHVKSLIAFSFEDTVLGAGNIYFSDCKRKRKWEEKEKSTLYECGKMISVFVFLRKEHSKDKEQITELLTKDQLTGLLNRKSFETEVKEYVAKTLEGRYALVFSDVNDFEYVNSNFGVEAGNRILYDYARSMEENEGMLLGCRIYSDYFIMLCKGRSRREIEENIRLSDEKFVKNQKKLYPASNLRLSTGICFVESGNVDFDVAAAIENANLARKRAKNQCSNQIEIYKDFFRKEKEHEQRVAGSIHEALRNKKIELFLQPKFSLMTRRMIGAEALVRWRREDGSLRSPVDFIPVLEKVGYIVELDFYMYEQVLIHLRKWRDQGKMIVPISVNFSRRHIQHDDFVKRICGLAERYDIEPGLIEIEITESSISENNQKMLNDMSKLQENGFKVDIDDFGTGYSSLNMLLNAPVDTVKVDKSFLKNIDKSEKERKYIDRLAHLINAAEKEIIFEGVETEHQAKILTECGYTMAQGYLFGKPIPAEEFDHTYMVQEKNYAVSM